MARRAVILGSLEIPTYDSLTRHASIGAATNVGNPNNGVLGGQHEWARRPA